MIYDFHVWDTGKGLIPHRVEFLSFLCWQFPCLAESSHQHVRPAVIQEGQDQVLFRMFGVCANCSDHTAERTVAGKSIVIQEKWRSSSNPSMALATCLRSVDVVMQHSTLSGWWSTPNRKKQQIVCYFMLSLLQKCLNTSEFMLETIVLKLLDGCSEKTPHIRMDMVFQLVCCVSFDPLLNSNTSNLYLLENVWCVWCVIDFRHLRKWWYCPVIGLRQMGHLISP